MSVNQLLQVVKCVTTMRVNFKGKLPFNATYVRKIDCFINLPAIHCSAVIAGSSPGVSGYKSSWNNSDCKK